MNRVEVRREVGRRLRYAMAFWHLTALLLVAVSCAPSGGGQKPVIELYDGQWDSLWVNNALAAFIIENGYGYPVQTVVMTSDVMEESLPKGEIDLVMELWLQSRIDWYSREIEQGSIVNLGTTYTSGPQFFIIPERVAEQYDIETIFDMRDHWEVFRDPEDPFKGVFYNCIISWWCAEINEVRLEAYGLTRYFNLASPASEGALEAALERLGSRQEPIFGYHWAPTWLMGAYRWRVLQEPPYSPECWGEIIDALEDERLRPLDRACAYAGVAIDKVAHRGLLQKAPDVAEMLTKMSVGLEPLNETLAWAKQEDVEDWERAAIYYLQSYEDRWESWVTTEAHERIKSALQEISGQGAG